MNVLFIHQNFPGQFVHLAAALAAAKRNRVVALALHDNPVPDNVCLRRYTLLRRPSEDIHPMLRDEESKILRAEACAAAALQLRREGFVPDVIVAHPGWGEALFIKEVFPQARLVLYCEYYYAAEGQDVGFDPADPPLSLEQRCRLRLKNSVNLLSMEIADAAISPTRWQKSTYPAWAQEKIEVIHDGIDTAALAFNPHARLSLAPSEHRGKLTLRPGDEVLTYVARNLEPVRGFDVFMRTLPDVQRRRPQAHTVIVGGDQVSYGRRPAGSTNWRKHLLDEVGANLDLGRIHFAGQLSAQEYRNLLSISKTHAYWTIPFVLSWSVLEAAISGVPVVASATPPVLEFSEQLKIRTAGYFDHEGFISAISEMLGSPPRQRCAPSSPLELDIANCIARQMRLLKQ